MSTSLLISPLLSLLKCASYKRLALKFSNTICCCFVLSTQVQESEISKGHQAPSTDNIRPIKIQCKCTHHAMECHIGASIVLLFFYSGETLKHSYLMGKMVVCCECLHHPPLI